ncbi:MAG: SPFH domain-containing protein, partial [Cyanobacteria bacterium J06553_1]
MSKPAWMIDQQGAKQPTDAQTDAQTDARIAASESAGSLLVSSTVETAPIETAQADAPQVEATQIQTMQAGGILAGGAITIALVSTVVAIALIKSSLKICKPNEILIVSGRKYKQDNGKEVGYRVIFGGRAFIIPIIERVEKMDMTTMPIPVEVNNSYAKGGTPLNIQAIATVKISSQRGIVGNAIERF